VAYRRTPAVQERLDAVRAELLAAALSLVAEQGYAGCSVADVAATAGVGTGTVYRYFPNKGELFAEVFRAACSKEVAAFTAAAQAVPDPPCECLRITAAIETFTGRALHAPQLAYALLAEPVDALVDAERLAFRESYRDLLATVLTDGIRRAQIPEQDVEVTAAGLIGAVAEALVQPLGRRKANAHTVESLITFTQRCIGGSHEHHARRHQPGPPAGRLRRG
jgi:AcrR family transcriptional regulator